MNAGYLRHLLLEEIADLEMNGCTADNWKNIKVASPFHAEHVCNVHSRVTRSSWQSKSILLSKGLWETN